MGIKTAKDLQRAIESVDRRGYPGYKGLRGRYDFGDFELSIDHVQGDPFAAPSKVSVWVDHRRAGFPATCYDAPHKRIAFEDYLVRRFGEALGHYSFKASGSGKSGLLGTSRPGPEILERTACTCDSKGITLRFEAGFPARGRTIAASELVKMLLDYVPRCVRSVLLAGRQRANEAHAVADLAEDQRAIRNELERRDLVAFVADGSVLPRASGVSSRPMRDARPFVSPASLRVVLDLPHRGPTSGMGIPRGVTLIVGGGYHGKTTLLKAIEAGVYNHVAGDGREYVITDATAVKLRAEDGRIVRNVDISLFIDDLPNKADTRHFSTLDASGSTSQAASTVEAVEAATRTFLIDEDTSATNFMVRDALMQAVVARSCEPITPFVERVHELYEQGGISTVLVAGSSGSFFQKATTVIQMDTYEPYDITERAHQIAASFGTDSVPDAPGFALPAADRVVGPVVARSGKRGGRDDRLKVKTSGKDEIQVGSVSADLRFVEQLVDSEQTSALAQMVRIIVERELLETCTVREVVGLLTDGLAQRGLAALAPGGHAECGLAMPRLQEIYACINRLRG